MPARAAATLRKAADRASASIQQVDCEPFELTWHEEAPVALLELRGPAESPAAWPIWQRHLARRLRRRGLVRRLERSYRPLVWGLANGEDKPLVSQWAKRLWSLVAMRDPLANELAGEAAGWLENQDEAVDAEAYSFELLAWCYLLPRLAGKLPPGIWWALLKQCIAAARSAAPGHCEPVEAQLRAVELPLALGALLGEIAACRELAEGAASIELPLVDPFGESRGSILASWTRSLALRKRAAFRSQNH